MGHQQRRRDSLAGHVADGQRQSSVGQRNVAEVIAADFVGRLVVVVELIAGHLRPALRQELQLHLLGGAQVALRACPTSQVDLLSRRFRPPGPRSWPRPPARPDRPARKRRADRSCRDRGFPAAGATDPSAVRRSSTGVRLEHRLVAFGRAIGTVVHDDGFAGRHDVQRRFAADRPEGHAVARSRFGGA